jgi:glutathione S-transferase
MMILRSVPTSPYGRKVKIAAKLLGLWDRIEVQPADPANPSDTVRQQNPLGKIPVLIVEDGTALYDSRVIVEYLDHIAGGGIIQPRNTARWRVLVLAATAEGIMDAALLLRYEQTLREEPVRSAKWIETQQSKIDRALAVLEAAPPALTTPPDIGQIGVACALGYLDLRFEGRWRARHPKLVAWLDRFAVAVPAFAETKA